jgi:hypothetical protein
VALDHGKRALDVVRHAGEEFLPRVLSVHGVASRRDFLGYIAHDAQHRYASIVLLDEAYAGLNDALRSIASTDNRLKGRLLVEAGNTCTYSASADARSDGGEDHGEAVAEHLSRGVAIQEMVGRIGRQHPTVDI